MPHSRLEPASPRQWGWLFLCWMLALVSTAASLFLSEIMDYVPCVLCWYQRVPMYALVIVLGVALWTRDADGVKYAQPLALAGLALAVFHTLLYLGYIPKSIQPCGKGPSCADIKLHLWGFVTIPLLSVLAFLAIVVGLFLVKRENSYEAK